MPTTQTRTKAETIRLGQIPPGALVRLEGYPQMYEFFSIRDYGHDHCGELNLNYPDTGEAIKVYVSWNATVEVGSGYYNIVRIAPSGWASD